MKLIIKFLLLIFYVTMTYTQQCRQVTTTVCDDVIMKRLQDLEDLMNRLLTSCNRTTLFTTTPEVPERPTSCSTSSVNGKQLLKSGEEVVCEDGWTVFQRRFDGSVNFQVGWDDYVQGFGDKNGEFWLGLQKIYEMTRCGGCELHIQLTSFDNETAHANYSSFSIGTPKYDFILNLKGYSGTAGDSLTISHNYFPFSTFDAEHGSNGRVNCAARFGRGSGGWWFYTCGSSALNAAWGPSEGFLHNIIWKSWKGSNEALKGTKMMLRCD
ncbi:fibrinogen C domain-containing protein 1-like [Clavelina lepadiformis]|uniref:fibrinogen C domain-containing protein 1-like n=1 Tax=Clavelina lepadiformis TaxID=159417 RepID=UPI004041F6A1